MYTVNDIYIINIYSLLVYIYIYINSENTLRTLAELRKSLILKFSS